MKQRKQPARVLVAVTMAPRFRAALDDIKAREGLPLKWQIEHAITLWAATKGITLEAPRG
jgi:hypothetical protein